MPPSPVIVAAAQVGIEPLLMLVDGWPQISAKLETRIGEDPIDTGSSITDHAVANPPVVSMVGVVSDLEGTDRVAEAWQTLYRLQQEVTVMRVITEWGIYEEMLVERAEGSQVGRGLQLELVMRQVLRVEAARVIQPVPVPTGGGAAATTPLPQAFGSADLGRSLAADADFDRGQVVPTPEQYLQVQYQSGTFASASPTTIANLQAQQQALMEQEQYLAALDEYQQIRLGYTDVDTPEPYPNPRQNIEPGFDAVYGRDDIGFDAVFGR